MVRTFAEGAALFVLPFLVYGMALLAQRWLPWLAVAGPGSRVVPLVLAGLALVLVALLALGVLAPRHTGVYVPAHIEDGRLVPGQMR